MFSKRHELLLLVATQLATYWCLVSGQTPTDAPTSMPTAASSEGNAVLGWILFVIICILCPGGICATCYYYVGKSRIQARRNEYYNNQQDPAFFNQHGMHGHPVGHNVNVDALPPHQNWVEAKAQVVQAGHGDVHYIDPQHIVTAEAYPQAQSFSNGPPTNSRAPPASRTDVLHSGASFEDTSNVMSTSNYNSHNV